MQAQNTTTELPYVPMEWIGKCVKCTDCGAFHYITHTWRHFQCSTRCIAAALERGEDK